MKTVLVICTALFFISPVVAADITARQSGDWMSAGTWDLNRPPADNDMVIIPLGITVKIISTPYPKTDPAARPTLILKIYGTLDFSDPGNDKFYLDDGSVIQLFVEGKILTTNNNPEIIAIYNGYHENTVWSGDPNSINGPALATSTSVGFLNMILTQKLIFFEAVKVNIEGKLEWPTNTSLFYNARNRSLQLISRQFIGDQQISLCIYDFNGRQILRHKLQGTSQVLPLPVTSTGVFIVQLKGDRGFTLSKKILIKH